MRELTDLTFRELTSPDALARRIAGLSWKTWIGLVEPVRRALPRLTRESVDLLLRFS